MHLGFLTELPSTLCATALVLERPRPWRAAVSNPERDEELKCEAEGSSVSWPVCGGALPKLP